MEEIEAMEVIGAIEEFSFCGEITFPMLRSEFALAHATLVMTAKAVTLLRSQ
jgi:hypothetical protein